MSNTQKNERKNILQSSKKSSLQDERSNLADETFRVTRGQQEDNWQDTADEEKGYAEGEMKDEDWCEGDHRIREDKQKLKRKAQAMEDGDMMETELDIESAPSTSFQREHKRLKLIPPTDTGFVGMADLLQEGILCRHRTFLEEKIDPDSGLLNVLLADKTLSPGEIREIRAKDPYHKRNAELLNFIIDKQQYNRLNNALQETKQSHLVNYLAADAQYRPEFRENWPLTEKEISILEMNNRVLVELINPEELVGRLYSRDVITKRQREAISSKQTCYEKNEAFLEILSRKSLGDYKSTILCLLETKQNHIAQILDEGGAVVRVHAEGLDDTTEDDIIASLAHLLQHKSFEESQRFLGRITEGTLNVIALKKGKSVVLYIYCKTLVELTELKEMQINRKLKPVIQCLFSELLKLAKNGEMTVETSQIPFGSTLNRLPQHSSMDEVSVTILENECEKCRSYLTAGVKLPTVCDFSPEEMSYTPKNELQDILKSTKSSPKEEGSTIPDKAFRENRGQQGDKWQDIADEEEGNAEGKMQDDYWSRADQWIKEEDRKKLKRTPQITDDNLTYRTFAEISKVGNMKEVTPKTSMSNLPFELLDSILMKSYLERVLVEKLVLKNNDYDAIKLLASVDCCWFQRIRRRKFKKEMWRRLLVYYRRKEKYSSIYRINRQYLEEKIRLKGLVNQLKSNDYLTNVQTESLFRQNLQLGKKKFIRFKDPMFEVMKKNEAMHSVFIRCLCDTKQHLVAEVIENGGALTKVEIKFEKAKTSVKKGQNLHVVKEINEIHSKMKARSHQFEKLRNKLKQDHLDIISASLDGYIIIVWIWCKTKSALEKLQTLNESTDVFSVLVKNLSFSSEERNPATMIKPKVNIDFEQFQKTVVSFSIVANLTSSLDFERTEDEEVGVQGVTKLRNKIYVLLDNLYSAPRYVILVFEDEIPFCLQKRIEVEEIKDPKDIASIEKENSLYVLDIGNGCIWKIKEDGDEDEEKMIRWLELEDKDYSLKETLSVTRDGQLLLVGRRKDDSLNCLRILGGGSEKADLLLTISLPKDIQEPCHAVETSKGNFIISHLMIQGKKENRSDGGRSNMEEEMENVLLVVSEVSGDGKTILRRFFPKIEEQKLSLFISSGLHYGHLGYLVVDSFDRLFLADFVNERVVLFDSNLQWNGILIPSEEDKKEERWIWGPLRLFYDEEKKELIVGGTKEVFVYTLNRK